MKHFIFVGIVIAALAVVLVSAVNVPHPTEKVWLQKQLTQCGEEWQQWVNEYMTAHSPQTPLEKHALNISLLKEGIVAFYQERGITIHDIVYEQGGQDAVVCFGCPCASGNTLKILSSAGDKGYFLSRGFSIVSMIQPPVERAIIGVPDIKGAAFGFQDPRVEGNVFKVKTSFSGGCAEHQFTLYSEEAFKESAPPELDIFLIHTGEDPCDGILTRELAFDLSPVRDLYVRHYQRDEPFTISVFANDRSSPIGTFTVMSASLQPEERIFTVGPNKVPCSGPFPQDCLIVNGEYFYGHIEGFDYQEGYTYRIKVLVTPLDPRYLPADALGAEWKLIEVISKSSGDVQPLLI